MQKFHPLSQGSLKTLIANEGETLAVGEIICEIETEEVVESIQTVTNAEVIHKEVQKDEKNVYQQIKSKARYSPAVLKLSQEHGIDLNQVTGTGMGGRITRKDLLRSWNQVKCRFQLQRKMRAFLLSPIRLKT